MSSGSLYQRMEIDPQVQLFLNDFKQLSVQEKKELIQNKLENLTDPNLKKRFLTSLSKGPHATETYLYDYLLNLPTENGF